MTKKMIPVPWAAFFITLGIAAVLFLPFIIYDGGYFTYYGDFNVQQIPFYKLAHESVRSGDVLWSFYTDLGANFIGSYSFYLLFSPFFWLTLPFPTDWVPFLMGPLLMLKTACAALTACIFLERFLRNRNWAIIGSILYAFSGWMLFNIFFNHFHEPAVFFPLLLLGVEKLVCENRRGFFAVTVAVNAVVNYWFFVGEAVFTLLYVLVRMTDPAWRMSLRKFLRMALEAFLGLGLSAVVLVPSVLALAGNPRTGTDNLLTGWNLWIYWQNQSVPAILQSMFYPPELPARLNFFPESGGNWSSRSAWLPLLGMTGVVAYFFRRQGDWLKKILALSLIFALAPGLNSAFILFNYSYYARWFYMPILLMCLASARALEDSVLDNRYMLRSLKWCLAATAVFAVMCGLTPHMVDGELRLGLANHPEMMWLYVVISVLCLTATTALVIHLRHSRNYLRWCGGAVAVVCVAFGIYYLANGKNTYERSRFVIGTAIEGRELITLEDEPFSRIDTLDAMDNLGMFWKRPTIQAFHSIVPPSLMEFYPEVGVKRDVGSRPEADYYALRPLLSVRWLFVGKDKEDQEPMPGYEFHSEQLSFNVYENKNYLPMGFGYTDYIPREELENLATRQRSNLLLRAVVLEDNGSIERHGDILSYLDVSRQYRLSYDDMEEDVENRRAQSAYYFAHDNNGFTSRSNLAAETLLFFSVPYDRGWTATVNGRPTVIEKVNIGFMAVRVPAGECEIRFEFFPSGLEAGAAVTGGSLLLLLAYLFAVRIGGSRQEKKALAVQRALFLGESAGVSWEDYLTRHYNSQARGRTLRQALDEPDSPHIRPEPRDGDQRFIFSSEQQEDDGENYIP